MRNLLSTFEVKESKSYAFLKSTACNSTYNKIKTYRRKNSRYRRWDGKNGTYFDCLSYEEATLTPYVYMNKFPSWKLNKKYNHQWEKLKFKFKTFPYLGSKGLHLVFVYLKI